MIKKFESFEKYNGLDEKDYFIIRDYFMGKFEEIFNIHSYESDYFLPFIEIKIYLDLDGSFRTVHEQLNLLYSLFERYGIYGQIEKSDNKKSSNIFFVRIPNDSYQKMLIDSQAKKFKI